MASDFEEVLRKYIPENSFWMHCIKDRQTQAWLMDGKSPHTASNSLSDLDSRLEGLRADRPLTTSRVLVLEDINPKWAQKLLSKSPHSVHPSFLAQNMMRFDSCSVTDKAIKELELNFGKTSPASGLTFGHDDGRLEWTISGFPPPATEVKGFHMDFDVRAMMKFGFERSGTALRRIVGLRSFF
jgi:hypothetical protein